MTKLTEKNSKERWYPKSIDNLRNHFYKYEIDDDLCQNKNDIISNICYNIQYVEYLRKTLNELNLTIIIQTQTIKSFIITCTSIIEATMYLICCKERLRNKIEWNEISKSKSNNFSIENKIYKSETTIFEKFQSERYEQITFDQMIKKIETRKILNIDKQFFKDLNHLRKLRNKIHLQETELINKSDYKTFWIPEHNLAKRNLRMLVTNEIFGVQQEELFEFLKTI